MAPIIAFLATLLLCCSAYPSLAQAPFPHLRLVSALDDDLTPVLYAQQAGLFRAAGLDVEVRAASSSAAVVAAVASGAVELGKSSTLSLISAHARGFPLTIVAPSAYYVSPAESSGIIVEKDSALHSARDLTDKVVSVPAINDLLWITTKAWIDQNGGDSSAVRFIEAPMSMVAPALDSARIVAGTVANPALTEDVATGRYRVIGNTMDGIAKRLLYSAWFADPDYVAQNRAAIERFEQVLQRASIYANGHHAQTVDLLAKFSGIEPSVIAHMTRTNYTMTLDPRDIQPLIAAAVKYKVIPNTFEAQALISPYALRR